MRPIGRPYRWRLQPPQLHHPTKTRTTLGVEMIASIRTSALTIVLSVAATILTWVYLAGGKAAQTQTRLDEYGRRIIRLEEIQQDLNEIKATLRQMQAEQRILHKRDLR